MSESESESESTCVGVVGLAPTAGLRAADAGAVAHVGDVVVADGAAVVCVGSSGSVSIGGSVSVGDAGVGLQPQLDGLLRCAGGCGHEVGGHGAGADVDPVALATIRDGSAVEEGVLRVSYDIDVLSRSLLPHHTCAKASGEVDAHTCAQRFHERRTHTHTLGSFIS